MSREIKFRGWNKRRKEMFQIDSYGECLLSKDKDEVVMQYTGLKDKNGVEIFEGDVVKTKYWKAKVIFLDAMFRLVAIDDDNYILHYLHTINDRVKIIGNIYENPELIKEHSRLSYEEWKEER